MNYLKEESIRNFITNAFSEDVGDGDHSTLSCIPKDAKGKARLLFKEDGILAGMQLAQKIFHQIDAEAKLEVLKKDGQPISKGDIGMLVEGNVHTILKAERLVLNCMQRMSGIATYTHRLNELIRGSKARLLDTRKTTPGFRMLEKWAVKIGGGTNHRFGLFDMIMLKDNHVDYAGGVSKAIRQAQKYIEETGRELKIEVETRNLEEVKEAIATGGICRIMLDNMTIEQMQQAVTIIAGRYETEASGGITESTIAAVAATGVDFISVGALTHSVKSLDISLKAEIIS